jgi:hypothetical protein
MRLGQQRSTTAAESNHLIARFKVVVVCATIVDNLTLSTTSSDRRRTANDRHRASGTTSCA